MATSPIRLNAVLAGDGIVGFRRTPTGFPWSPIRVGRFYVHANANFTGGRRLSRWGKLTGWRVHDLNNVPLAADWIPPHPLDAGRASAAIVGGGQLRKTRNHSVDSDPRLTHHRGLRHVRHLYHLELQIIAARQADVPRLPLVDQEALGDDVLAGRTVNLRDVRVDRFGFGGGVHHLHNSHPRAFLPREHHGAVISTLDLDEAVYLIEPGHQHVFRLPHPVEYDYITHHHLLKSNIVRDLKIIVGDVYI